VTDEVHAGRTRARPRRAGLRRGARAALLSSALLAMELLSGIAILIIFDIFMFSKGHAS